MFSICCCMFLKLWCSGKTLRRKANGKMSLFVYGKLRKNFEFNFMKHFTFFFFTFPVFCYWIASHTEMFSLQSLFDDFPLLVVCNCVCIGDFDNDNNSANSFTCKSNRGLFLSTIAWIDCGVPAWSPVGYKETSIIPFSPRNQHRSLYNFPIIYPKLRCERST